ncbi:hypothetical protein ABNF97_04000 [Plantactinospora sp. B6F1]|uniref:hypothetical protein n=1 Tax=Plantactinospora sp. B6F1 TaxID=3158971 RepID=UPI0032D95022
MSDRLSSFAADLSALLRTMPGLTATPAERAAWFDRKANLLEQVADDPGSDRAEVSELARLARVQADELRRRC